MLLLTLLFLGCGGISPNSEHPAITTVQAYIENSSIGQWDKVMPLLSGQALEETKNNIALIKHHEKILSQKTIINWSTDNLAEVYCDVTKNDDRVAYKFYLGNMGGHWKVYKTSLTDFARPALKAGELSSEAKDTVEKYFALTTSDKRKHDTEYLAGRLLRVSLSSKQIQGVQINTPETSQKVVNINSLGISEDYAIVEVLFEDSGIPGTAIVDLIKVNGKWKITSLELSNIN